MATIITGDNSKHTDAAVEWLKANGATIEDHEALSIITLPDTMQLEHSHPAWKYVVSLKSENGDGKYVEICTDADPYKIEMYLEGEDIEEGEE